MEFQKTIVSYDDTKFMFHFVGVCFTFYMYQAAKQYYLWAIYPQISGYIKVTNRTLSTFLMILVPKKGKKLREEDLKLVHAEFAYNKLHLIEHVALHFKPCIKLTT